MVNIDENKLKAIENAMSQIEKQFGKGSIMKLGEHSTLNIDSISTGCLDLDIALGIGGVPRGRIIEIYGPESSGKTTVALHVAAEAQKSTFPVLKEISTFPNEVSFGISTFPVLPLAVSALYSVAGR